MEDASCHNILLQETYCYLISGRARSGKTNVLKIMIRAAHSLKGNICIIDDSNQQLQKIASDVEARYVTTDQQVYEYWKDMMNVFVQRNKEKRQLIEEGLEEDEIFTRMRKTEPIFLFISDMEAYMKRSEERRVGKEC